MCAPSNREVIKHVKCFSKCKTVQSLQFQRKSTVSIESILDFMNETGIHQFWFCLEILIEWSHEVGKLDSARAEEAKHIFFSQGYWEEDEKVNEMCFYLKCQFNTHQVICAG